MNYTRGKLQLQQKKLLAVKKQKEERVFLQETYLTIKYIKYIL